MLVISDYHLNRIQNYTLVFLPFKFKLLNYKTY